MWNENKLFMLLFITMMSKITLQCFTKVSLFKSLWCKRVIAPKWVIQNLLLRWDLQQQKVTVRIMIGILVWGRVRIKIRIGVGVMFNISVYHWSKCRRSKRCTFPNWLIIWGIPGGLNLILTRRRRAQPGGKWRRAWLSCSCFPSPPCACCRHISCSNTGNSRNTEQRWGRWARTTRPGRSILQSLAGSVDTGYWEEEKN